MSASKHSSARPTLTPRQGEVLALLRVGLTNEEIAERMGISLDGAKWHVSEIISRLGVRDRYEAATWQGEIESKRVSALAGLLEWMRYPARWFAYAAAGVTLFVLLGAAAILVWGVVETSDAELQPVDVVAPTPTPTPSAAGGPLTIRVVEDVDGDGVEDAEDQGAAGWSVNLVCGGSGATSEGTDAAGIVPGEHYRTNPATIPGMCWVTLQGSYPSETKEPLPVVASGWMLTSAARVDLEPSTQEVTFLIQRAGEDVMHVSGTALVDGLPSDAQMTIAPQYAHCARFNTRRQTQGLWIDVYIVGSPTLDGCPAQGTSFDLLLRGYSIPVLFDAGASIRADFEVGPRSMQTNINNYQSATIGGVDCGVGALRDSPPSPTWSYVFVLSASVRPGCGAPGRVVEFRRVNGETVTFDWQAGSVTTDPFFCC